MAAFDLVSPTADVGLPVPPYVVRNFLSSNKLTSASKVMIPGLNYTAVQIMRDSDQIITVSTRPTNAIPEFDNPAVVSFISFLVATLVVLGQRITRPRSRQSCGSLGNQKLVRRP
jgi:hypothetical protein